MQQGFKMQSLVDEAASVCSLPSIDSLATIKHSMVLMSAHS